MASFLGIFRKAIAAFLTFFFTISASSMNPGSYAPKDSAGILLNAAIISDAHTEGNNQDRGDKIIASIKGVTKNEEPNDALILLGDNTMNGQEIEQLLLYGTIKQFDPADNVIAVMGNHDAGNGESKDSFETLKNRFVSYNQSFFNSSATKQYYTKTVNGYTFIVLGSEAERNDGCFISTTQVNWLDAQLASATASGKPVFVLCHFPTFCIDDESGRLDEVLTNYENVFMFVGHTHWALDNNSMARTLNGKFTTPAIYCPCLTVGGLSNVSGDKRGCGVQLEVYGDSVVVRSINYTTGEWLPYEATFSIK